jgi:hypothetical protein
VIGVLGVAIVAFVLAGLFFPSSWLGRMLAGAGIALESEPRVVPAAHIQVDTSIPRGVGLVAQLAGTPVTYQGSWAGWCKVWGTDPDHPQGVEYYAGALEMTVEGQNVPGYCIDLHHTLERAETYRADVYISTEPALCPVYWILANYSHDRPGPGLSGRQESAAIQAAIWHFTDGFRPQWDPNRWCYQQAVYDRALEILAAARGQCLPVPAGLSLDAGQTDLALGQAARLRATVTDHQGQPLPGQQVSFDTSLGEVNPLVGTSGVGGAVGGLASSQKPGTATVTASLGGTFSLAVVDPVAEPYQRVTIRRPMPYPLGDAVEVTWSVEPGAVVESFTAELSSGEVLIRWQTSSEVLNQGFHLYHATGKEGPWTRLNDELIPSRVPEGEVGGARYEWGHPEPDPEGANFYLLEAVDTEGVGRQHGPISP